MSNSTRERTRMRQSESFVDAARRFAVSTWNKSCYEYDCTLYVSSLSSKVKGNSNVYIDIYIHPSVA